VLYVVATVFGTSRASIDPRLVGHAIHLLTLHMLLLLPSPLLLLLLLPQVLGHTKTILVLLISWLVLGEAMGSKKLAGMAVAVAGMIAYSYFMTMGSTSAKPAVTNSSSSSGCSSAPNGKEDPADAVELGKAHERRGDWSPGKKKQQKSAQEEGEGSDVPLLRVVSRDTAEWSNDSVKMVVVERANNSKQGNR
jgi:hypothetical protein